MADGASLVVVANGSRRRLRPGESFTFGRSTTCTLCLDRDDTAISRLAGAVEQIGEVWFVTNRSNSRQLAVVDHYGLRRVLGPGQRDAIEGRIRVIVEGAATHEIVFEARQPTTGESASPVETGQATLSGQSV